MTIPPCNGLEARVAGMLGKEAALFAPSGTMANQLAIRTHTEPGDEILINAERLAICSETTPPSIFA